MPVDSASGRVAASVELRWAAIVGTFFCEAYDVDLQRAKGL